MKNLRIVSTAVLCGLLARCQATSSLAQRRSVPLPANATEIFGVYAPDDDDGPLATWMARHPDDTPLARLNIPGTHDSATWNYTQATQDALAGATAGDGEPTYPPEAFRCQRASIAASLGAGVRFFDLRFAADPAGARLVFWHAQALLSDVATLGDVVAAFYHWLDRHPSETVLLSLQYEGGTAAGASFDEAAQRMLFDGVLNTAAAARHVEQTRGALPALGAARGKVVLLRRFDLDRLPAGSEAALPGLHLSPGRWTDDGRDIALVYNETANRTAYVEDYYEPADLGDRSTPAANIAAKLDATVAHLEKAASDDPDYAESLFITFASAEHDVTVPIAVTPQVMALGTGNSTTPAGGVNHQILPTLKRLNRRRLGIVVVDFWDQPSELVESIIGDCVHV